MTNRKHHGLNLRIPVLRAIFIATLIGLWGALAIKCFLPGADDPADTGLAWLLVPHGILTIGGLIGVGVMLWSDFSFVAQSADAELDERELAARNRAHYLTLRYVLCAVLLGWCVLEFGDRFGIEVSREIIVQFLMVLGFTGIIGPAGFLALQTERNAEEES
jgi:hypothetical protein